MSLFKKKQKSSEQLVLVLDIGSASVAAGIVLVRRDQKPIILYQVRKYMAFQEELDFKRFVLSMKTTLRDVLADIERHGLAHVVAPEKQEKSFDRVLVTYASPWYISHTKILRVRHQENEVLTEAMVDALVSEEEQSLGASDVKALGHHLHIIERAISDIKLNGYRVQNPYGKKAQHMAFTLSVTAISQHVHHIVEEEISRVAVPEASTHHSFAVVGAQSIYAMTSEDERQQVLLLDVGGEVSDVVHIAEGAVREAATFPLGSTFFVRTLVEAGIAQTAEVGYSMLRLYAQNKLEPKVHTACEHVLTKALREWYEALRKAQEQMAAAARMPRHIYITAGTYLLPTLVAFLQTQEMSGDIVPVDGTLLLPGIRFREKGIGDSFIALEALYAADMVQ